MESVGARLRGAREGKGYTLEQIARDTHIAKRFLGALEDENFAVFPGEPYLLGFMRTYSSYLGLDPEETVNLYYNLKLQEQPPPIDELISKGSPRPVGRILIIVAAVIVVGAGVYFGITSGIFERDPNRQVVEEPETPVVDEPAGSIFEMSDEIVEQRFAIGDRVIVPLLDNQYSVDLDRIEDGLVADVDGTDVTIPVGESRSVDINGDGTNDLRIALRSVDQLDSPPTVVVRLDRGAAALASGQPEDPVGDAVPAPAIGSTLEPTREETARLIAAFDERDEFSVEVRFEGYSLFRYQLDDEDRVEQYYQAGDSLRLSARDEFRIWVSNAGSARLRVAGTDISLGDPGEVTAGLVTWVQDPESGRQLLELLPVY